MFCFVLYVESCFMLSLSRFLRYFPVCVIFWINAPVHFCFFCEAFFHFPFTNRLTPPISAQWKNLCIYSFSARIKEKHSSEVKKRKSHFMLINKFTFSSCKIFIYGFILVLLMRLDGTDNGKRKKNGTFFFFEIKWKCCALKIPVTKPKGPIAKLLTEIQWTITDSCHLSNSHGNFHTNKQIIINWLCCQFCFILPGPSNYIHFNDRVGCPRRNILKCIA